MSIGLHFDLAQLIVRVLEEQTLRSQLDAKIEAGAKARGQHDLRDDDQNAAVAMLRRFMGSDFHIEKMLLAALPWIRNAFVARRGVLLRSLSIGPRLCASACPKAR